MFREKREAISLTCAIVTLTCVLNSIPAQEKPEAFTKVAGKGYCPAWTPDGSAIVYGSMDDGTFEIRVTSLADGTTRQVTTGGGYHPALSPDGKRLAYGSDRSGSMDIWVVDLERQLGRGFRD